LIRFRGSLTFANCSYLEDKILEQTSTKPKLKYIIIVGNGINEIDASGEEMLSSLIGRLKEAKFEIFFSGLNDIITDVFKRTDLYKKVGEENFFRNITKAVDDIHTKAHGHSDNDDCPLLKSIELK